jgi:hypothetical protein
MQKLDEKLKNLTNIVKDDPNINVLYHFGSFVKGTSNKLSDLDFGILLSRNVPIKLAFDLRLKYIVQFSKILSSDKVDVIILNNAPLHLAYEVVSLRNILFEHDSLHRIEFEVNTINRFLDFKPFFRTQISYVKDQITKGVFFD